MPYALSPPPITAPVPQCSAAASCSPLCPGILLPHWSPCADTLSPETSPPCSCLHPAPPAALATLPAPLPLGTSGQCITPSCCGCRLPMAPTSPASLENCPRLRGTAVAGKLQLLPPHPHPRAAHRQETHYAFATIETEERIVTRNQV